MPSPWLATTACEVNGKIEAQIGAAVIVALDGHRVKSPRMKTAFLFPGQGSQQVGYEQALFETAPLRERYLNRPTALSGSAFRGYA